MSSFGLHQQNWPQPVAPEQVDAILNMLWGKAAKIAASKQKILTRSCSWNIVSPNFLQLSGDDSHTRQQWLQPFILSISCRLIELAPPNAVHDSSAAKNSTEILAAVENFFRTTESGEMQLCAEHIQLSGTPLDSSRLLVDLLRALKAEYLPLALLCLQLPPEPQGAFQSLLQESELLLLDTDAHPQALKKAALLLNNTHATIQDLAWMRLLPLRLLLASEFDDPSRLPLLKQPTQLHIQYASQHPAAGRLLMAWLLACCLPQKNTTLHIKPTTSDKISTAQHCQIVTQQHQLHISLQAINQSTPDGIVSLHIKEANQQLRIERSAPDTITIITNNHSRTQTLAPPEAPWEQLVRALSREVRHTTYAQNLHIARQLPAPL